MKQYKSRPSNCHFLFTEPKLKKDKEAGELSQSAKTEIERFVREQIYERKFDSKGNKQTENGTDMEDNSIEILEEHSEYENLKKNEKKYSNDWIEGTPDLVLDDKVIDIKTSYSGNVGSFPLFDTDIHNKQYIAQLQAYMLLTGKEKAELIYVLGNVKEDIIRKEHQFNNPDNLIYDEFKKKYIYDNVDIKYRIKRFTIDKDPEFEEKLKEKVLKAREYQEELSRLI